MKWNLLMYSRSLFLLLFTFSIIGCERNSSPTRIDDDLSFTLLSFQTEDEQPDSSGKFAYVSVKGEGSSISYHFFDPDTLSEFAAIKKILPWCKVGDSIKIHFHGIKDLWDKSADSITDGSYFKLIQWVDDPSDLPSQHQERYWLTHYSDSLFNSSDLDNKAGVQVKFISRNKLERYKKGDEVLLYFYGRSLDGEFQDTLFTSGTPFRFMLGQEHQLIPGLAKVAELMSPGEECLVLLSSANAFGLDGSSALGIPPRTPMIYCVKTIDATAKIENI